MTRSAGYKGSQQPASYSGRGESRTRKPIAVQKNGCELSSFFEGWRFCSVHLLFGIILRGAGHKRDRNSDGRGVVVQCVWLVMREGRAGAESSAIVWGLLSERKLVSSLLFGLTPRTADDCAVDVMRGVAALGGYIRQGERRGSTRWRHSLGLMRTSVVIVRGPRKGQRQKREEDLIFYFLFGEAHVEPPI